MIDTKRLDTREMLMLDGARLLASWASRQYKGRLHISSGVNTGEGLCGYDPDEGRDCSKRCTAVRSHLEMIARYLGCEVEEFLPKRRSKKQ